MHGGFQRSIGLSGRIPERPIMLIWDKDFGMHGIFLTTEYLVKLTAWENLGNSFYRELEVNYWNFRKFLC